jgi:hypothetical protein
MNPPGDCPDVSADRELPLRRRVRWVIASVAGALLVLAVLAFYASRGAGDPDGQGRPSLGTLVVDVAPDAEEQFGQTGVRVTAADGTEYVLARRYRKTDLPPGRYRGEAIGEGLTLEPPEFAVEEGRETRVRVRLSLSPPRHDRRAAERVLALGGKVTVRADGREDEVAAEKELPKQDLVLTGVDLRGNGLATDEELRPLAGCSGLRSLDLFRTPVTDAGLKHFSASGALERVDLGFADVTGEGLAPPGGSRESLVELWLCYTRASDKGLEQFGKCAGLKGLSLAGTLVTDRGLERFEGCDDLELLDLGRTGATDRGLRYFQGCTKLRYLNLEGCEVTDAGLDHLEGCTKLEHLSLGRTGVSDKGVARLAERCASLTYLDLDGTSVSDESVTALSSLSKLKVLWLRKTRITAEGLARLRKKFPPEECAIHCEEH